MDDIKWLGGEGPATLRHRNTTAGTRAGASLWLQSRFRVAGSGSGSGSTALTTHHCVSVSVEIRLAMWLQCLSQPMFTSDRESGWNDTGWYT